MEKKVICQQCGAVNVLGSMSELEDVLSCRIPKDLDWFLPMQVKIDDHENPIYVDQEGAQMSRERYILKHNLDPEIAQEKMKRHIGVYVGD